MALSYAESVELLRQATPQFEEAYVLEIKPSDMPAKSINEGITAMNARGFELDRIIANPDTCHIYAVFKKG